MTLILVVYVGKEPAVQETPALFLLPPHRASTNSEAAYNEVAEREGELRSGALGS